MAKPTATDAPPAIAPHRGSLSRMRRSAKRNFTLHRIKDYGQTILWSIPLTLLIWIYADREQSGTLPEVPLTVVADNLQHDRVVSVVRPEDGNIRVEVSGPRSALNDFRQRLDEQSFPPLRLRPPEQTAPGQEVSVGIREQIANDPRFVDYGLTVERVYPSSATLFVDQLVEESVPARLPEGEYNLSAPPVFEPSHVLLRGPQAVIQQLRAGGALAAVVELTPHPDLLKPGPPDTAEVTMVPPAPGVTVEPRTVRLTMHVSEMREEQYEIDSLPIWVVNPAALERYEFRIGFPTLTNVVVAGPAHEIDRIRAERTLVKPVFAAGNEDVGRDGQRRLTFYCPPGVRVISVNGGPPDVMVNFESTSLAP